MACSNFFKAKARFACSTALSMVTSAVAVAEVLVLVELAAKDIYSQSGQVELIIDDLRAHNRYA